MNKLVTALVTGLFLAGIQSQAMAMSAQQNKMKTCNADAKTKALKGDERKAFMKDCLSAKKEAPAAMTDAKTTQQMKMKTCNADAKTKAFKGDERQAFMKDCLSAAN
jgi:psiF repeat